MEQIYETQGVVAVYWSLDSGHVANETTVCLVFEVLNDRLSLVAKCLGRLIEGGLRRFRYRVLNNVDFGGWFLVIGP